MLSAWFLVALAVVWVVFRNYRQLRRLVQMRARAVKLLEPIPGPPAIPLLGSTHLFKWDNEEFTYQLDAWAREYMVHVVPHTGIMKIWVGPIPMVFLASCEAAKPILESNTLLTKSPQYNTVRQWIGEGLLISAGKKWTSRRKMITPTFHFNILQGFYDIFFTQANVLVDQIAKYADKDEAFDMFPYIKRMALDIICETAMGTQIHAQTGKSVDYVQAVTRLSQLIWDHERFPWLWFRPLWYASGMGFEFDRLVKLSSGFTRKVLAQRRELLRERGLLSQLETMSPEEIRRNKLSFLDLMIGMQAAQNLSDEDIREEVDTFMFEGHDTTSSGIGFALWWLGQESEAQTKCQAEIDAVLGDSDRALCPDDLKDMPYLEMCLKEALRLNSPVPLFGRTLDHDVKIAHYTIPEGITVFMSSMSAGRDPRNFAYPDLFYPEHFLPENCLKRNPYAFIPFSAGPRNCIGQKFAMAEEKCVVATLLRKYRFITAQPHPHNRFLPELVTKPSNGFKFFIKTRK